MTNKLLILDLDGVLIDSRDLHYDALNAALEKVDKKYVISREMHLSKYDGLNTTKKLKMLNEEKGLPTSSFEQVWKDKQIATFDLIKKFPTDERACAVLKEVKNRGWKVAVASNSIRETVKIALLAIGVMEYVDFFVSNEDVKRTKPFPEMYFKCMIEMNTLPKDTLIVEDSHLGRQGAIDSGANLLAVENAYDWDRNKIFEEIDRMENKTETKVPWIDSKLNVVIPMSGDGSRFASAGYTFPKPLIEVRIGDQSKTMIDMVVSNLNIKANYIFIVKEEHYEKYDLEHVLNNIAPNCKIIQVKDKTSGAAASVLLAKEFIDNDNPMLVANSDQFIPDFNSNEVLYAFKADSIDAGILCFKSSHPKWSYCRLNPETGFVSEVAEKKVISDIATVGVYYWTKGSDFVKSAEQMIEKNILVNGEHYLVPTYNEMIADGAKIRIKMIDNFFGTGVPEDLDYFLANYKGKI